MSAASEDNLKPFAMINQTEMTKRPLIVLKAKVAPMAVATPLPPLNW